MSKFKKKPVVIEAITFDELVAHGRKETGLKEDGMPWSFDYAGHPITHEDDACYLIPCCASSTDSAVFNQRFTPQDMLITNDIGGIEVLTIGQFKKTYERTYSV